MSTGKVSLFHSKSALQWYMQDRFGLKPKYEIEVSGKDHRRFFQCTVKVWLVEGGFIIGKGSGTQRKDAEKEAALYACWQLESTGVEFSSRFTC